MGIVASMLMSNEVVTVSFVDPTTTVGRIVSVLEVQSMTPVRTCEYSQLPRAKWLKRPSWQSNRHSRPVQPAHAPPRSMWGENHRKSRGSW